MIASTLIIQELTGQQRSVVLRGAGLPLQGASWKTEQKLVTRWYAGNPWEATQHVMGPMDPPSEWRGVWNTTRLVAAPPSYFSGAGSAEQKITVASDLRDVFDGDLGIIRAGALLRVTWATDDGRSIARQGRIGPGDFAHTRMDDIAWTMSFIWTGRGGGPPTVAQYTGDDALTSQRAAVSALNDVASTIPGNLGPQSADPTIPLGPTAFTIGDLEAVDPDALVEINGFGDQAAFFSARVTAAFASSTSLSTSTAFDASADASIAAQAAATYAGGVVQRLGQIPVEKLVSPGTSAGTMAAVAAWVASIEQAEQVAEARAIDMALAARKSQNALGSQVANRMGAGAVRATVSAKTGETFASLSQRWYGTPDLAGQLARANGVPSYQVAPCPGQVVAIPVLSPADLTAP